MQVEQASEKKKLTDREREAFQEIFDLLIPDDFRILSYNKKRAIKSIMKILEEDIAIIRLKMRKIHQIFERLTENEQTHEGDIPPLGTS